MRNNKNQHYVSEFYLKAWRDSETPQGAYTWMASKDGSSIERKSPSKIFYETDLYTLQTDGNRDLSLEKSLAQIEGDFSEIRRNKLEKSLKLNIQDKIIIYAFAAAIYARTP